MRTSSRESKCNQYAARYPNKGSQTKVSLMLFDIFLSMKSYFAKKKKYGKFFRAPEYLQPCLQTG